MLDNFHATQIVASKHGFCRKQANVPVEILDVRAIEAAPGRLIRVPRSCSEGGDPLLLSSFRGAGFRPA